MFADPTPGQTGSLISLHPGAQHMLRRRGELLMNRAREQEGAGKAAGFDMLWLWKTHFSQSFPGSFGVTPAKAKVQRVGNISDEYNGHMRIIYD